MPVGAAKPGSVSDRIKELNDKASAGQANAQKPTTFQNRSAWPKTPALTRVAVPSGPSPSPVPSSVAEATYGRTPPTSRPVTPATSEAPPPVIPIPAQQSPDLPVLQPAVLTPVTPSAIAAPNIATTSSSKGTPSSAGFGRRETQRFMSPAVHRTDFAHEHHNHLDLASLDSSFPPSLPMNTQPELRHPIPNSTTGDKALSRLKRLHEADASSPLAKFRRTDTKKLIGSDESVVMPLSLSLPSTPINGPASTNRPAVNNSSGSEPSTPAPPLKEVDKKAAAIEALTHQDLPTDIGRSGDGSNTSTLAPTSHTNEALLSPSEQASQIPGAYHFDLQPEDLNRLHHDSPVVLSAAPFITAPASPDNSSVASPLSPDDVPPTLLTRLVTMPYIASPSPINHTIHDNGNEDLAQVSSALDAIVLDYRAAFEDIITRLAKASTNMSKDYDNADVPNLPDSLTSVGPAKPTAVNPVPEDEMKVEHPISTKIDHFPEPHKTIATSLPKLNDQASVLLDLMRQIKHVAAVWSVDLELVESQPCTPRSFPFH